MNTNRVQERFVISPIKHRVFELAQTAPLHWCISCLSLIALSLVFLPPCAAQKRSMVVNDLFRLEVLREISISPDGKLVAYVIQRPSSMGSSLGWPFYLEGNERADVWVASVTGNEARNLTNGAVDGAGSWDPVWSQDGQWLAMLSTRNGRIGLWAWSERTGVLRPVSNRPLNPRLEKNPFLWASEHRLLFWVMPADARAFAIGADTLTPETAGREWAKARDGRQSTSSVLESGIQSHMDAEDQSQLLLADVETGSARVIDATSWVGEFSFATLRLSPDHCLLAYLKQTGTWVPRPDQVVKEIINPRFELMIADLRAFPRIHSLKDVYEPFWGSLVWAPDGTTVAVTAYGSLSAANVEVLRCAVREADCHAAAEVTIQPDLNLRNMVDAPPYFWLGGRMLILGERAMSRSQEPDKVPRWWMADEAGRVRPFLKGCDDCRVTSDQLLPDQKGNEVLAILRGSVWRINDHGVPTDNLIAACGGRFTSIVSPPSDSFPADGKIVLKAHHNSQDTVFLFDTRRRALERLSKPSEDAEFVACDSQHRIFAFAAVDASGTFLWLKNFAEAGFKTLLEANQFLREVEEGKLERIAYQSLDGASLNGWIILPVGYRQEKRYPVITWVYAGQTYSSSPPDRRYLEAINNPHPLNLQLLAAHGYAVFMPSMPVPKFGEFSDPYMELAKGVLPGLTKVVELGIGDPERLGVMGQSTGGFSTFGLITQTDHFKAAVALAGFSDLVSFYGTLDARWRYQPTAHQDPFRVWDLETRGMGGPPWKDLQRYVRNSPISYVDRVHTPILIIHGDLDPVPIQQSEEFFTALYRQNKRAAFVRYWGEDHVLTSPANIRDMWERIYKWFDEFLGHSSN